MVLYRRTLVPGASYFFTVTLLDRRASLLTDHIDDLRMAFSIVKKRHPFHINAIVVLPDHVHCIWTMPADDADFSLRWREIKSRFSRKVINRETITDSRIRRKERGIWQRRFWEHLIRNEQDYQHHMDYTHYNPVKHGYVDSPGEWPYSSFHTLAERGFYPPDWSGGKTDIDVPE